MDFTQLNIFALPLPSLATSMILPDSMSLRESNRKTDTTFLHQFFVTINLVAWPKKVPSFLRLDLVFVSSIKKNYKSVHAILYIGVEKRQIAI